MELVLPASSIFLQTLEAGSEGDASLSFFTVQYEQTSDDKIASVPRYRWWMWDQERRVWRQRPSPPCQQEALADSRTCSRRGRLGRASVASDRVDILLPDDTGRKDRSRFVAGTDLSHYEKQKTEWWTNDNCHSGVVAHIAGHLSKSIIKNWSCCGLGESIISIKHSSLLE